MQLHNRLAFCSLGCAFGGLRGCVQIFISIIYFNFFVIAISATDDWLVSYKIRQEIQSSKEVQ